MSSDFRIPGTHGQLDRQHRLRFRFNGRELEGFAGDTLASALLANGIHRVGRSFKYHRPRGIFSAGPEEPNALMTLHHGTRQLPNSRATTTELTDGLQARSQNHIGPLSFDLMAINDLLSPLLTAGFYYKSFMWPAAAWEKLYEPLIRRAAGLGALSGMPDGDAYDKGNLFCDLLVIGAGPAGLNAALNAARSGARVIIADEDFRMGGRLNAENQQINNQHAAQWASDTIAELESMEHVQLMPRTTIYGAYDHGIYGALEITPHNQNDTATDIYTKPAAATNWKITSKRAILAAGALERPIVFAGNDRPGIMLAGATRAYANRWAVACGRRVTLFTNNDDGWQTAHDLHRYGVEITAIIDTRQHHSMRPPDAAIPVYNGDSIISTSGRQRLRSIRLASSAVVETDCLAVAGGWSPTVHLTCHHRGRPRWDETINAFVPADDLPPGMHLAGAVRGQLTLATCLADGYRSAAEALEQLGRKPAAAEPLKTEDEPCANTAFWFVRESGKTADKAFVDLQNDVTTKDIRLAHQEGYRSVEHLKRYTTLGMATDQGKTANIPGLAIMAELENKSIAETGTTIFRPPYTPVPIGAFAGRSRGRHFRPRRVPPTHDWAKAQGAVFIEAGQWMRAQWYPQTGETEWRQSVDREVLATRGSVGICDVSTLGKIDIQGPDAAEFLNRVYANRFGKLPVGKLRYGLMLREDGFVMDDGTCARLGEQHFLMTTTTANAGLVFRHLEFCRQCLWPEMDVQLISVTDQFAQVAIAGPASRAVLEKLVDADTRLDNDHFPFMACSAITLCGGVAGRLFRISFSGELAWELAVPARYGNSLMQALMQAGAEYGITPYGTEALGVMRVEKGHPAGNELNGQTTARMLGMDGMVSKTKDCIGAVLRQRPALAEGPLLELVGFMPLDNTETLTAGAHFLPPGSPDTVEHDQGWMSSVAFSPVLQSSIGLGFIRDGRARIGEVVRAVDLVRGKDIAVTITSPHFIDPEGERLHG